VEREHNNHSYPANHSHHENHKHTIGETKDVHHAGPPHKHDTHHAHMVGDFRNRFWICLGLTIPILLLSPMIQRFLGLKEALTFTGSNYILLILSAVVYFYGGWPFLKGIADEFRAKQPGMMTLIAIAITVAFAYSAVVVLGVTGELLFMELATLIDIMLLGHWIEMKSVMGASRALEELVRLMPSVAHRVKADGSSEDVPIDTLKKGDRFLVKPGEKFATDGVVVDGHTGVDESLLTGESRPVHKMSGDKVIGGAINGEGSVTVEVEKVGHETFLSQVVELVRKAQESKSHTQDLANRAALWLTIIALTTGAITLIAWLTVGQGFILAIGKEVFAYSIERMVTVMVITCPHALGLAIPLVVAVSTALAAKNGLLLRNRTAFEQARLINAVVFDKTGTLTEGRFGVQGIVTFSDANENEVLRLAASLETASEHPIGEGIVGEAKRRSLELSNASDFEAIKGKGIQGNVGGSNIMVVSPGYLDENSIRWDVNPIKEHYSHGRTVVFVLRDKNLLGAIALGDAIRPESKGAIEALHRMGITCIMLTGDKREVAQAVASSLGLDEYFAEVLPDRKAGKIRELMNRGMRVAMTGDGINDAPALATADVGIAIGAGTDVALETADIILVKSDPRDVVGLLRLARATYGKMVQNLIWATGYNVVAIPLAAGVLATNGVVLSPAVGAILMSLSTIIVAINAKFLIMK